MSRILLLWDIDGTITHIAQAGERALTSSWEKVMGYPTTLADVDYRGRTDVMIFHKLMAKHGVSATPQLIHELVEGYLKALPSEIHQAESKHVHPGVINILERARSREDIAQALLTGNLSQGAQIKLEHFNVWHYFEFGAFANDSANRNDLGPVALRRASEAYGHEFAPERTFIIGDTPHDIECAKVIGAHCIAVATGSFSIEELQSHHPSAVLADLSDTEGFFRLIERLCGRIASKVNDTMG
jgi:phosphoglycolate phosphatase-like HAD superfamily hydrolase